MTQKAKNLINTMNALVGAIPHTLSQHQLNRLIEWSRELDKCRSVSSEVKEYFAKKCVDLHNEYNGRLS